jgi:hypothetical protein
MLRLICNLLMVVVGLFGSAAMLFALMLSAQAHLWLHLGGSVIGLVVFLCALISALLQLAERGVGHG